MCRNIKVLFNFDPPTNDEEIRAAATQFVRKISGFTHPSQANEKPFSEAIERIAELSRVLLDSLVTNAPPRNRFVEAQKARERALLRFPKPKTGSR